MTVGPTVTIVDVAQRAGVSRQTVSNVFNEPSRVRPETRARVENAIAELGYRPHRLARRLRTQELSVLALRFDAEWDEGTGSFLDRFLHALIGEAEKNAVRVQLYTAADAEDEMRAIKSMLESREVDRFVLTSSYVGDPRLPWLEANGIPAVLFGRPWTPTPGQLHRVAWVDVDGAAGTEQATRTFLEEGRRRVAYLGWPSGSATGRDRKHGWSRAMEAAGTSAETLRSLECFSTDELEAARAAVGEFVERGEEFDAIVCASDTLALGALTALRERGRSDAEVSGFDNSRLAQILGISSVDQNVEEIARLTFARLRSVEPPAGDLVVPTFVRREADTRSPGRWLPL